VNLKEVGTNLGIRLWNAIIFEGRGGAETIPRAFMGAILRVMRGV